MSLHRGCEDLLPIYQSCVFRSDARVDSHWHIAKELAEHSLSWKRGVVDVAMYKRRFHEIEMYVLRYGAEVEVRPRPFDGFALVHMSLRGGAEIEVDHTRLEVGEGRTALLAPRQNVRLNWHAGTEQLIMKLPHRLIEASVPPSQRADRPGYMLPSRFSGQWGLLVRSLLNVLRVSAESMPNADWLEHYERNVAMFLFGHVQSVPVEAPPELLPDDVSGGEMHRMDALLQYMQSHLCAPVSLTDLARAAGVSVRTLNAMCHRHYGETPMNLLRNLRLDAVRAKLRLQPGVSITATALDHGFGHHGRFSAYYLKRFGELPRQTANTD